MTDRREYMKQYNTSKKEELAQNRKLKNQNTKLQKLKDELNKTIKENDWFDPNRNPYLKKLPSLENQRFQKEKEKRFNLQYDIDHFWERKKGDTEKYKESRMKAYSKFRLEEDIKFQIIRWRMFRKAVLKKLNREPDFTDMMENSVCKPPEICPDDEFYRPDLLYLLDEYDDEEYEITTYKDWADEDSD